MQKLVCVCVRACVCVCVCVCVCGGGGGGGGRGGSEDAHICPTEAHRGQWHGPHSPEPSCLHEARTCQKTGRKDQILEQSGVIRCATIPGLPSGPLTSSASGYARVKTTSMPMCVHHRQSAAKQVCVRCMSMQTAQAAKNVVGQRSTTCASSDPQTDAQMSILC